MEKENKIYTYFDLEQALMQCWNVTNDLKAGMDRRVIAEYYEQKFEHTWEIFKVLVKEHYDRATSSS